MTPHPSRGSCDASRCGRHAEITDGQGGWYCRPCADELAKRLIREFEETERGTS